MVFIFRFQWEKKTQTITWGNFTNLNLADAQIKTTFYRSLLDKEIDPRKGKVSEQAILSKMLMWNVIIERLDMIG